MRHKGINKEETRQKMVTAISSGFRKQGYAGIGVDGLAKAAGVTSGAFYSHFGSKGGAFNVALIMGLDEVIEAIPTFQREHKTEWVEAFASYYLGRPHRENVDSGCAMASLTAEVVRFDEKVHIIFEEKMIIIAELIAQGLSGESSEECSARAWSMLSILIGGVNLTRAMQGVTFSNDIADSIKLTAVNIAGETRSVYEVSSMN